MKSKPPERRTCRYCGARRILTQFITKTYRGRVYYTYKCLECGRQYARKRRKQWKKSDPSGYEKDRRSRHLRFTFGMTAEEYDALMKKQRGVCAICKKPESQQNKHGKVFSLAIDHCHSAGTKRGLLCSRCNRGIGFLQDDTKLLLSAVEYINKWRRIENSSA